MNKLPERLLQAPAADPQHWLLDPSVVFLNHGSFGSCPRAVLAVQQQWRERLERQPVRFLVRELEGLWDEARASLARFIGADPDGLVFVPNATTGVNTILRGRRAAEGEEWLVTDHEYNACRNAFNHAAQQAGARVVTARVPFPFAHPDELLHAILGAVTPRTRFALLDHVTSQTGVVLPMERLVRELSARGVEVLVDGSHAPGMVPLDLEKLGAAYYTGNCHKWLCAPKGAAFLHVRKDRRDAVRPLVISHGANSNRTDRSRFLLEFGWMGTGDPTAWLCVPEALRFMATLLPGGWPAILERNRALARAGRDALCAALQIPPPCPTECLGSLAALPLPPGAPSAPGHSPLYTDPLQDQLLEKFSIEIPVIPWPQPPQRLIRISAQLYNSLPQYERLAQALLELLR